MQTSSVNKPSFYNLSSGGSRVSQIRVVGGANLFLAIFFKILYKMKQIKSRGRERGYPLRPPLKGPFTPSVSVNAAITLR